MNIGTAIAEAKNRRPSVQTNEEYTKWLSELDGKIYFSMINPHAKVGEPDFLPYSPDNMATELIIPFPFDSVYVYYLLQQIDLKNGEIAKYNNSTMLFESKMKEYTDWWGRNNPKTSAQNFIQRG